TDIVHQYVEPTPLLLNAIDDVLDAAGRSEIRLYKESRSQAWSRRRARGGGDRGTAQFKTTYDRFSYTLRATGHENTLAFELIAKNDKRIAVLIHREKVLTPSERTLITICIMMCHILSSLLLH